MHAVDYTWTVAMTFERAERAGLLRLSLVSGTKAIRCPGCGRGMAVSGHEAVCSNRQCPDAVFTVPEYLARKQGKHVAEILPDVLDAMEEYTGKDADGAALSALASGIVLRRAFVEVMARARQRGVPDTCSYQESRLLDHLSSRGDSRYGWAGHSFLLLPDEMAALFGVVAALTVHNNPGTTVEAGEDTPARHAVVTPEWVGFGWPGAVQVSYLKENEMTTESITLDDRARWSGLWSAVPVLGTVGILNKEDDVLTHNSRFEEGLSRSVALRLCAGLSNLPGLMVKPDTAVFRSEEELLEAGPLVGLMETSGVDILVRGRELPETIAAWVAASGLTEVQREDSIYRLGLTPSTMAALRTELKARGLRDMAARLGSTTSIITLDNGGAILVTPSAVSAVIKGREGQVCNFSIQPLGQVRLGQKRALILASARGAGFNVEITLDMKDTSANPGKHVTAALLKSVTSAGGSFMPSIREAKLFRIYMEHVLSSVPETVLEGTDRLGFSEGKFQAPGHVLDRAGRSTRRFITDPTDKVTSLFSAFDWASVPTRVAHPSDELVFVLCYLAGAVLRASVDMASEPLRVENLGTGFVDRLMRRFGQGSVMQNRKTENRLCGWPLVLDEHALTRDLKLSTPTLVSTAASPDVRAHKDMATPAAVEEAAWVYSNTVSRILTLDDGPAWLRADDTAASAVALAGERFLQERMGEDYRMRKLELPTLEAFLCTVPREKVSLVFLLDLAAQTVSIRCPMGSGIRRSDLMGDLSEVDASYRFDGQRFYVKVDKLRPLLCRFYGEDVALGMDSGERPA